MKRTLTTLLFTIAILGFSFLATPVSAQTRPVITANTTFIVEMDHDGVNTDGYRLFLCSGVLADCTISQQTVTLTARGTNGVVRFTTVPGLARGTYTLQGSAFNLDRETKSAALVFDTHLPAPSAPGLPRIPVVTIAQDGTVSLRLLDLASVRELLNNADTQ